MCKFLVNIDFNEDYSNNSAYLFFFNQQDGNAYRLHHRQTTFIKAICNIKLSALAIF